MIELNWCEDYSDGARTMSFLWGPTDGDVSDPAGWVLSSARGVPEEMFDEVFDATRDGDAVVDPAAIDKLCSEAHARYPLTPSETS